VRTIFSEKTGDPQPLGVANGPKKVVAVMLGQTEKSSLLCSAPCAADASLAAVVAIATATPKDSSHLPLPSSSPSVAYRRP